MFCVLVSVSFYILEFLFYSVYKSTIAMSTTVDQKAYLQKYLSGPSKDKKKKKKKVKAVMGKGFKIIDDDLDLSKLRALETDELDVYGEGEDAPQVAGIIDERPEELRRMEQFATKWKVINQDDGFNSNIQIEEIKQSVKEVEKENEIIFGKMYSDSEDEREREAIKQDSNASPPRKKLSKKVDSPQRKKVTNYDSDASPPRKRVAGKKNYGGKSSKRQNDDSDASPPRKNSTNKQNISNQSRNNSSKGHNEDRDASPPRKNSSKRNDASTLRNKTSKTNYDSDASPPRKNASKTQFNSSSLRQHSSKQLNEDSSPPRKKTSNRNDATTLRKETSRNNYDSDASPPRKYPRKGDASPSRKRDSIKETTDRKRERVNRTSRWGDFEFEKNEIEMISQEYEKSKKKQNDSDLSPPRKKDKNTDRDRKGKDRIENRSQKRDSDCDPSPPRRNKKSERYNNSDSDLSPPRKNDSKKRNSDSPPPTNKRMAKTLEGKMAGLQDAKQLRQENESFRRREDEVFNRMGDEVSGRNAKAVTRKSKRDTSEDRAKQREKAERQKEIDEKYKMWSKGLKQIEDHQERMADFSHEASKPLARHRGDADLEGRLRGVEREGDPMLQYIRERKREKGLLPPEKPSYKGSFPPNRFNIRPGYRWDGVDRSNGYEKKYFDQQSKRKAQEEEAYKWSTEDL